MQPSRKRTRPPLIALLLEPAHERGTAPRNARTAPEMGDPVVEQSGAGPDTSTAPQAVAAPGRVSHPPGRLGLGDRTVEKGDVEAEGRVRGPLHVVRIGPEPAVGVGQRLPQLMEELPQVVAGVRRRRVRPEGEGEVRPRLRCVRVRSR